MQARIERNVLLRDRPPRIFRDLPLRQTHAHSTWQVLVDVPLLNFTASCMSPSQPFDDGHHSPGLLCLGLFWLCIHRLRLCRAACSSAGTTIWLYSGSGSPKLMLSLPRCTLRILLSLAVAPSVSIELWADRLLRL